jgi:hypothetical protein
MIKYKSWQKEKIPTMRRKIKQGAVRKQESKEIKTQIDHVRDQKQEVG